MVTTQNATAQTTGRNNFVRKPIAGSDEDIAGRRIAAVESWLASGTRPLLEDDIASVQADLAAAKEAFGAYAPDFAKARAIAQGICDGYGDLEDRYRAAKETEKVAKTFAFAEDLADDQVELMAPEAIEDLAKVLNSVGSGKLPALRPLVDAEAWNDVIEAKFPNHVNYAILKKVANHLDRQKAMSHVPVPAGNRHDADKHRAARQRHAEAFAKGQHLPTAGKKGQNSSKQSKAR